MGSREAYRHGTKQEHIYSAGTQIQSRINPFNITPSYQSAVRQYYIYIYIYTRRSRPTPPPLSILDTAAAAKYFYNIYI